MADDIIDLLSLAPQDSDYSVRLKRALSKYMQDSVLVFNPTDKEHIERWEGIVYRFPPKSVKSQYGYGATVVHRYVAENYLKNMEEKVISNESQKAIDEENDKRRLAGLLPMSKIMGGEEEVFTARANIYRNAKKRAEVRASLYGGVIEKYGAEDIYDKPVARQESSYSPSASFNMMLEMDKKAAQRPTEESILVEDEAPKPEKKRGQNDQS